MSKTYRGGSLDGWTEHPTVYRRKDGSEYAPPVHPGAPKGVLYRTRVLLAGVLMSYGMFFAAPFATSYFDCKKMLANGTTSSELQDLSEKRFENIPVESLNAAFSPSAMMVRGSRAGVDLALKLHSDSPR